MLTWAVAYAVVQGSASAILLALGVAGDVIIVLMVCGAWDNTRSGKCSYCD